MYVLAWVRQMSMNHCVYTKEKLKMHTMEYSGVFKKMEKYLF